MSNDRHAAQLQCCSCPSLQFFSHVGKYYCVETVQLSVCSWTQRGSYIGQLNLNAPIASKVVCFSHLLKCLRSLYGKQCGPRSDCFYRSSLFWVHAVCFYTFKFVSNVRQLFAAEDFSRRHFQVRFFLGALRVKSPLFHCAGSSRPCSFNE